MRIAIVGAGAAGTAMLDQLASHSSRLGGAEVVVFESSPLLWKGNAYRPDTVHALVNGPADAMSIRAAEPGHFSQWLGLTESQAGSSFPARSVYGDYLEHTAVEAMKVLAASGVRVAVLKESVCSIQDQRPNLILTIGTGQKMEFDRLALCVGGIGSSDPVRFFGKGNSARDPYPLNSLVDGIGPECRVGVIGSGLTAVDTVLALRAHGHKGSITLSSRSGKLPGIRHVHSAKREPRFLRRSNLENAEEFPRSNRSCLLPAAPIQLSGDHFCHGAEAWSILRSRASRPREDDSGRSLGIASSRTPARRQSTPWTALRSSSPSTPTPANRSRAITPTPSRASTSTTSNAYACCTESRCFAPRRRCSRHSGSRPRWARTMRLRTRR
ncbi:FAD/NAD(P)-binding protein [Streptomyces sp. NPDC085614]|uniref:FAD/NAD(P)-binding protein n=1 Tax=Streptomyces sp. NPDC085614 TaxID=3365733 RepID=UPI0037D97641